MLACVAAASGQVSNPVYVDDSPVAADTLARVYDNLATGNTAEAARVLQKLLDEQPERLVADPDDPDLFTSVRRRVHAVLLSEPALLERYRAAEGATAAQMVEQGRLAEAERTRLLTRAGLDAALALAERALLDARFETARLILEEVAGHPDRGEPSAGGRVGAAERAAQLASLLMRYVDRADVRSLADRLGGGQGERQYQWPAAAQRTATTPLDPGATFEFTGLLSKPLSTGALSGRGAFDPRTDLADPRARQLPEHARDLWFLPAAAADTIYVNDGVTISAWDHFTLTPRWRTSPPGYTPPNERNVLGEQDRAGLVRQSGRGWRGTVEDPVAVVVSGPTLVAVTGYAVNGARDGDARVHALDPVTGAVRWSVTPPKLDGSLVEGSMRGPPMIGEGVVVVAIKKLVTERRLRSLALVGLDESTGELVWVRTVGSAGSQPYQTDSGVTDGGVLHDGVVYRPDRLGVVGAFEAATGRPVWVRRLDAPAAETTDPGMPWQMSMPIIDGARVIFLAPDRREILALDRDTGAVVARRRTDRFMTPPPTYLVRAGGWLVAVGDARIAWAPLAGFDEAEIRHSAMIDEPGLRGRVVASGERVIVPTVFGLSVYDPSAPEMPVATAALESPGNVLPLESELVVVDDDRVHNYLLWERAEAILSERMASGTDDAAAAVTFAELAFRAGVHKKVLPAVDAALATIDRLRDGEEARQQRGRLFEVLNRMASVSQDVSGEERPELREPVIGDPALLAAVIDRMGRAVTTPQERVAYLFERGRLEESESRPGPALETYQRVLDAPELATTDWIGPMLSVRAELEASRRIEAIVERHGARVYASHELAAQRELEALGVDAMRDDLVSLARRYPMAGVTPRVWLSVAEGYRRIGDGPAEASALESGLAAAERAWARDGGDAAVVGELAGRLVGALEDAGQVAAAAALLSSIAETFGQVPLIGAGGAIDPAALEARLAEAIASTHRWPRIGIVRAEGVQLIDGYTLMQPLLVDRGGRVAGAVAARGISEVALFAPVVVEEGPDGVGRERLVKVWAREVGDAPPYLVKLEAGLALFAFDTADGLVLARVDAAAGRTLWESKPVTKVFPVEAKEKALVRGAASMSDRVPTPLDGYVRRDSLLVCADERTVVVIQRGGRAAAFDLQTGEDKWGIDTPVQRVYDAALKGGTLVIAGDRERPGGRGDVELEPALVVVDARTGEPRAKITQPGSQVRWVRLADGGDLIIGVDDGVYSVNLPMGRTNWRMTDRFAMATRDAWVFGDTLFLLGASTSREVRVGSVTTGRLGEVNLSDPRGHLGGIRPIGVYAVSPDAVAMSSHQGVLVYSQNDGKLLGIDSVGGFDAVLPPAPAHGALVTVDTIPVADQPDGTSVYALSVMESPTAMLRQSLPLSLGSRPRSIAVMDGRVLISAGDSTIVLRAPEE